MSLHDKPAYNHEAIRAALRRHGMKDEGVSQMSDAFRLGWVAAIDEIREQENAALQEEFEREQFEREQFQSEQSEMDPRG